MAMTASTTTPASPATAFLLNKDVVHHNGPTGRLLLDALRRDRRLVGTKEGCREGDCGACGVLLGELDATGSVTYRAVPACMLLVGHARGRHVVTIEGLDLDAELTPQQQAIVKHGGSQCGFCTPGFVVSFTGFLLNATRFTEDEAITAIGGNLCRCTGYVPLVRAARELASRFEQLTAPGPERIAALVAAGALPPHFLDAHDKLRAIASQPRASADPLLVAGGTDLIVQRGAALDTQAPVFALPTEAERQPFIDAETLIIPAAATFEDLRRSAAFHEIWPTASEDLELFASALIRERATVAGNIANASPIADGTAMLLALDAKLELAGPTSTRRLPLADFHVGYKQIDLAEGERIQNVRVELHPTRRVHFNKISKRTYLDIATVNSAIGITVTEAGRIEAITLSAGGVAPTPLTLKETAAFLTGKTLSPAVLLDATGVLDTELAPIDDVRGSAAYKRLALRQLFLAHFLELFPQLISEADLMEPVR